MVITWFGLSSLKITSGNFTLVTDPYSKNAGLTPPRLQTDVAVISNIADSSHNNREALGGENTFVIDGPGEFDVKGIFASGIAASGGGEKASGFDYTTIYNLRVEDIHLGFLGSLKQKELTDEQLEELGEVNILFVPVGGHSVTDAEEAMTIVSQVEPQIVVPIHYDQPGLKLKLDAVDKFLKEIGARPSAQEKLTLKKTDLAPDQQTQVVLLSPQRS